jgi:hypothetical protein
MRCLNLPGTPHAREDDGLVSTPFHLMERLDGRVWMDQSLPGMRPAERNTMAKKCIG